MNHERSREIYQTACQLMPGGVNSAARAFGAVGGNPIVMARGEGPYLIDVDGNRYIDYIGSWGPLIFGHAPPEVVQATTAAISNGTSFGAPTVAENQLAELIIDAVPSVEMVRLVNSGTEATMCAIRLARGATGREKIVKFSGNYHGHVDALLVAAGSAAATLSVPDSPGVTAGASRDTIIAEYNDHEGLAQLFADQGDSIAAVIFEPVVGNMGCVIPTDEFLAAMRSLTREHGALLICDEVMTGFRVARGGAQERFSIDPDLTTLGKIVGGGLPLAAFGGRRDLMEHILPAGKVFQAGTLSGNPVATAAGIAMLTRLRDEPPYEYLEEISATLETGLQRAIDDTRLPCTINRVGSMMTLFFSPDMVTSWASADRCDRAGFATYFWDMLERGVYLPCSQFEAMFVSAAHQPKEIEATITAAQEVLETMANTMSS